MRTSIIALFALVASPLLVLAAPSSQVGSLAVRGLGSLNGDFLGKLDDLTSDQIANHIEDLTPEGLEELLDNITDEKLEKIVEKLQGDKFSSVLEKLNR